MEDRIIKGHKISLYNRETGMISGVNEVISFDPGEIILDTELGVLMIHGEDLHVTKLMVEKGEVELSGSVDSMTYTAGGPSGENRGGLIRRLFG
ncbi:MAG: sporulation protein YabP [Eubacterium sp.]|nr:sporulation protein YabP [Eubacterium sp.]